MASYKVLNIEEKTAQSGAKYKMLSLGEKGTTNKIDGVSFWGKDEVKKDDVLEGTIEKNDKGYNTFKTPFKQGGGGAGIATAMVKVQEKKVQDIKDSQTRKDESIKLSSVNRDATLILTSQMNSHEFDNTEWKQQWLGIREWLLNNWEMK
jgi:hypothetical protein